VYVARAFSVQVSRSRVIASPLAPVLLTDQDYLLTLVWRRHHPTGLLAVPVFADSAAYAVVEAFGLRWSLELPVSRVIVGATIPWGAALSVTRIDPMGMLFWSAVSNGIVAVPMMIAVMLVVSNGREKNYRTTHTSES
jgi:hypothetical protein